MRSPLSRASVSLNAIIGITLVQTNAVLASLSAILGVISTIQEMTMTNPNLVCQLLQQQDNPEAAWLDFCEINTALRWHLSLFNTYCKR